MIVHFQPDGAKNGDSSQSTGFILQLRHFA